MIQTKFEGKEGVRGFAQATLAANPGLPLGANDHLDRWLARGNRVAHDGHPDGRFPWDSWHRKVVLSSRLVSGRDPRRTDSAKPRLLEPRDLSRADGADAQGRVIPSHGTRAPGSCGSAPARGDARDRRS